MRLTLFIRTSDDSVRVLDLGAEELPSVLGRDSELAQIAVADSQVSRAHCVINRDGPQVFVEDLGSRNGTYINDQKITRHTLRDGEEIRIGSTRIRIEVPTSATADPLVGQKLGGFNLNAVIGKGRYGTVYRGLQVALARPVAVKVLAEEYRKDPERVQAFLTEARRAGRLNHPNLVQVHDVCQINEHYLLIMELMKCSMADLLRVQGPLSEEVVLSMICDVAKALAYAESQRLVHRDVKPDNILVNEEGIYKLADLGIATPIAANGQAIQERTFGSPHYVAPEQARGGVIDGRADLYALGATAWHVLTGSTLYTGSSRQVVTSHMNAPIPDLQDIVPSVSNGTAELIHDLLQKSPGDRPTNAEAVLLRIEQIRKKAMSASERLRTPRMRRRRARRHY
jgi:serine/threonine protein kinase